MENNIFPVIFTPLRSVHVLRIWDKKPDERAGYILFIIRFLEPTFKRLILPTRHSASWFWQSYYFFLTCKKIITFFCIFQKKILVLCTKYAVLPFLKQLNKSEKRTRSVRLDRFRKSRKVYLSAGDCGKIMLWQACTMYEVCSIKKVLHCHFPDLSARLSALSDPRIGPQYTIEELVMASIVLFLLKCDSWIWWKPLKETRTEKIEKNYLSEKIKNP